MDRPIRSCLAALEKRVGIDDASIAANQVHIPKGAAVFPKEIVPPVRRWMEARYTNIRHWTEMTRGGHFAAFEQPELFIGDLRAYFGTLR